MIKIWKEGFIISWYDKDVVGSLANEIVNFLKIRVWGYIVGSKKSIEIMSISQKKAIF